MNDASIPAMHNALLTELEKIHNNAELKEVSSLNYQIRTLISNVEETKMIIHQLFTFYQNKLNANEPNVTLRI